MASTTVASLTKPDILAAAKRLRWNRQMPKWTVIVEGASYPPGRLFWMQPASKNSPRGFPSCGSSVPEAGIPGTPGSRTKNGSDVAPAFITKNDSYFPPRASAAVCMASPPMTRATFFPLG